MVAELILYSNAIFDSVKDEPFAGGIAIAGKKIIAVGKREEIETYQSGQTKVYELGDKLVMPGFIDSHGHYDAGADYYFEVACHDLESCSSEEECARMMGDFAKAHPELEYYTGQGWYLSYWGDNPAFPTAESLDRYIPDKPVYLTASDLHSMWLNSKAMELMNFEEITKDMSDEHIIRDENGKPTGVVREHAFFVHEAMERLFGKTKEQEAKEKKANQKGLLKALNAEGITGFSDVNFVLPDHLLERYQYLKEIEKEGDLSVRIYIYPGTDFEPEPLAEIKPYENVFSSDELHISGVKSIMDGVTATYTAVMLEPYLDKPDCKGVPAVEPAKLTNWIVEANRLGYSCRVHCIGDGAVRACLDAYEKSNSINDNTDIRNAIEHIEIIDPTDIPRFGKLGVIASMQPRHQVLDKGEKLIRCGMEKSRYEWPFRSIMNGGGLIALGTDFPVTSFHTYENIYMGLTTRDLDGTQYGTTSRDEVFTLPEAIKGYTINGAYLNGMEEKVGTLESGKYADITVADQNLFAIPVDSIKDCKTVLTIMNGKVVYEEEK